MNAPGAKKVVNKGPAAAPKLRGIVKQVLSGDTIVVRSLKGAPPPEKQISLFYVLAPRLVRRHVVGDDEPKDEPWAWDSREFLRKKLIGQEVWFSFEKPEKSIREFGYVWLGNDWESGENIVETMVREGLVKVRGNRQSPEVQRLVQLERQAKLEERGSWSNVPPEQKVRYIKWTYESPADILEYYGNKPIKAIIEQVRDGSTVRAFLLPDFQYITLMISGIRCPGVKINADGKPDVSVKEPFADEARFYVESRLLQREVEIRLESVNKSNLIGTILFPKGNIAESLLREGLAKCLDWSMSLIIDGAEKLRAAEQMAKGKLLRLWQDYEPNKQTTFNFEGFSGRVVEVFNGDFIKVKQYDGETKKVFFSSVRPPRDTRSSFSAGESEVLRTPCNDRSCLSLYEVPFMFEAREFLRKTLVNMEVYCTLDYISPPRDHLPEKCCYTVLLRGQNVAEIMVASGLWICVRHRQDDKQRSPAYNLLLAAEIQASKDKKGLHGNKDKPSLRITDLTADRSLIEKEYLPSWQLVTGIQTIAEYVSSGSRFRLYLVKEICLVNFRLAGISCPRPGSTTTKESEPFGEEALAFSRDHILQRDVSVQILTMEKNCSNVIGWLWTDNNVNLSVALVKEGLAMVHVSAEESEYYQQLKSAEDLAKAAKKNIWSTYNEEETDEEVQRELNYIDAIVTDVTSKLTFYAQSIDDKAKIEALMNHLRVHTERDSNLKSEVAYTPKRENLCAARFSADDIWYRAKIEGIQCDKASVLYIDYGNREIVAFDRLTSLPPALVSIKPYATEYALALVQLPFKDEDTFEAYREFSRQILNRRVKLNVELKSDTGLDLVTVLNANSKADVVEQLITDGYVRAETRYDRSLKDLAAQYKAAEQTARTAQVGIWKDGNSVNST